MVKRLRLTGVVLWIYGALVAIAIAAAAVRLYDSTEMPGLAAIELVLLALPWSLALQIEPFSHLGWPLMIAIVTGGVAANGLLLRKLGQALGKHERS